MTNQNNPDPGNGSGVGEYGPLGEGHTPIKDPMKGFRGVVAGMLILEAITIFLALTVVLQIDDGQLWTPFNWGFITILGVAHLVLAFMQRYPWALKASLILQGVGLVGGFFVHWSLALMMFIFIFVWWYVLTLRNDMMERMRRGMLVTQHIGYDDEADADASADADSDGKPGAGAN